MTNEMIITVDDLDRIVLPKEVRQLLEICGGATLKVVVDGNKVILEKVDN